MTIRERANWLGVPQYFNLNHACLVLGEAFGVGHTFLVGSCLKQRDFRDVDVRTILPDEEFKKLFPGLGNASDPLWSLMCASISLWLSQHSGLPIDYQIQSQTHANEKFDGERSALGIFVRPT